MKSKAAFTAAAALALAACTTGATGQEVTITDSDGYVIDLEDGESTIVRMVETDGDEKYTRVCVFVAGDEDSVGALTCEGGDVRIVQFGPGEDRQIIIGDDVFNEEAIRELVESQLAYVSARMQEMGDWEFEYVNRFDTREFQEEMHELQEEMMELHREMSQRRHERYEMSEEERAEFEEEIAEFEEEMAEFQEEMAELQAEILVELAEEMAELHEEGIYVSPAPPVPPHAGTSWFSDAPHYSSHNRQVIRVERDGEEHVTIIEHDEDDDGNLRTIIRTTDPSSVEVVEIDPHEHDEE